VLTSAAGAIASALDTQVQGTPVVVYNQLNTEREDVVDARLSFPQGVPQSVRVFGPDGKEVPSQLEPGDGMEHVLFLAKAPSVGFSVYDVRPADTAPSTGSDLKVSESSLENARYRISIDSNGDVSSIFDKKIGKELLSAPARLAFQTEHPHDWPAWNMDWDDQKVPPRAFVSGPAQVRVVENGPVRVAVEITRETEDSKFVQTIRLSAGDPGNRVEFGNVIDWMTKEAALKASFPLTASNPIATYNWGLGTVQRTNNDELKFEVASHQWFDLTDKSGAYGVTVLSDCKTGSDKPDDNTLRLTLLYTPGLGTGNGHDYSDQTSQDWGHHEFIYGLAAHAGNWTQGNTDWQAQRLNAPLIGFQSDSHPGTLGKTFSFLHVDSNHVFVSAVKKAEESNDVIVRVIEMRGEKVPDLHIALAGSVVAAREVNGQEQPLGPATVAKGEVETSLIPYGIRTFAVKLAEPAKSAPHVHWESVELKYDLATASEDGAVAKQGFDASGENLPADMLPTSLPFGAITFRLGPAWTDHPNAVVARGQSIALPRGKFNRVYILAAADGDQTGSFQLGQSTHNLKIPDWQGFIGQWDTRTWITHQVEMPTPPEPPASDHSYQAERDRRTRRRVEQNGPIIRTVEEYSGLTPGFIKRAPVAWYASHHHSAEGGNEVYSYCYLYGYSLDLPEDATTLTLPDNDKIRIMAVTVAEQTGKLRPAQPLYDVLGGGPK
jgi:alpha-mannosidase